MNVSIYPHLSKHVPYEYIYLSSSLKTSLTLLHRSTKCIFLPSKAYAFLNDKSFESSDWYVDCINRGELPSLLGNISPLFHTVFLFLEIPD